MRYAFRVIPNSPGLSLTNLQGNDDQSFWALAALTAHERAFPAGSHPYLSLASAVFDTQAARWDDETCGGGLRWQIFTFNNGYNYKNSMSNAQFFQLAARLAFATGNKTYSEWAEKEYTWAESIGMIDTDGAVYDGTDVTLNCTQMNHIQWTATSAAFMYGTALMYNMVRPHPCTFQSQSNLCAFLDKRRQHLEKPHQHSPFQVQRSILEKRRPRRSGL
jgi:mannan endo-1,6-alpha-mannosidase